MNLQWTTFLKPQGLGIPTMAFLTEYMAEKNVWPLVDAQIIIIFCWMMFTAELSNQLCQDFLGGLESPDKGELITMMHWRNILWKKNLSMPTRHKDLHTFYQVSKIIVQAGTRTLDNFEWAHFLNIGDSVEPCCTVQVDINYSLDQKKVPWMRCIGWGL